MTTRWPGLVPLLRRAFLGPRQVKQTSRGQLVNVGGRQYPPSTFQTFDKQAYSKNEIAYAGISEIATSAPEATLRVFDEDGKEHPDHPTRIALAAMASSLNMSEFETWEWLIVHGFLSGNMLLEKVRSAAGLVVELWPMRIDRTTIRPGSDRLIAGYGYRLGSTEYPLDAADVLHWKWPSMSNDYWGESPLRAAFRHVIADNDATDLTASFLSNFGAPGFALITSESVDPDSDEAKATRESYYAQFGGKGAGGLFIAGGTTKLERISFNMDELAMPDLSMIAEARILSVLGVPPILVGAIVGLKFATYANYGQARLSFWEETIGPLHRRIADKLNADPDLNPGPGFEIRWDVSEVQALQSQRTARHDRVREDFKSRLTTRDEAREDMGLGPAPAGEGGFLAQPQGLTLGGPAPAGGDDRDDESKGLWLWPTKAGAELAGIDAADFWGTKRGPTRGRALRDLVSIARAAVKCEQVGPMVATTFWGRPFLGRAMKLAQAAQTAARQGKSKLTEGLLHSVGTTAIADAALDDLRPALRKYFAGQADDVRALVKRHEAELTAATKAARHRVAAGQPAAPETKAVPKKIADDLDRLAKDWETKAVEDLWPILEQVVADTGAHMAVELGIEFSLDNEHAKKFVKQYRLKFSRQVSATTKSQVRDLLVRQQAESLTIDELQTAMDRKFQTWDTTRSEQTARSESIRASNAGAKATYAEHGATELTWMTTDNPCPYCATMNGKVVGLEQAFLELGDSVEGTGPDGEPADVAPMENKFQQVDFPPLHPQCQCTILSGRVQL